MIVIMDLLCVCGAERHTHNLHRVNLSVCCFLLLLQAGKPVIQFPLMLMVVIYTG